MAQIKKHAEFMDLLHGMITKEATAGKATGKPGADTHYASVSKETEKVNKNEQGHPEHNPQEFKQEPNKEKGNPTKKAETEEATEPKVAETVTEPAAAPVENKEAAAGQVLPDTKAPALAKKDASPAVAQQVKKADETPANEKLAELGNQLLAAINELKKEGTAGTATGKPGADTHYTSVSKEHETVNKNEQGHPEHNPQEFKQEASKDKSDPTKKHADEAVELDKEASYELGRQFARTILTSKVAGEAGVYKEAGRRDFEALIAQASAELENESKRKAPVAAPAVKVAEAAPSEDEQIKLAEEAGAQAFYALLKQAQEQEAAKQAAAAQTKQAEEAAKVKTAAEEEIAALKAKVAAFEEEKRAKAEEDKLDSKLAAWSQHTVQEMLRSLKNESSR